MDTLDRTIAASPDHKRYFMEKLGLSERLMERCLGEALSAGGDFADLYFESVTSTSLGMDEGLIKTASQGISVGCGIRVLSGERTGFAYTDDLSSDRLLKAARTAALIASGPAKELASGFRHVETPSLYPIAGLTTDADLADKLKLIERADKAARAFDSRITQVRAGINDELRRILVAASDGTFASDTQPLARLNVFVIAKDSQRRPRPRHLRRRGPRRARLLRRRQESPEHYAREAARTAHPATWRGRSPGRRDGSRTRPRLARRPAPRSSRPMASRPTSTARRPPRSPASSASRSRRPRSPSSITEPCANRRGSLNVDDEGVPTRETVLIENGILKGFLTRTR